MQLPVTIALRPSRRMRFLLAAVHGLAFAAVLSLDLPWPVRLAVTGLLLASGIFYWRRKTDIVSLILGARGNLEVATNVGTGTTASLLPETTLLPGLVLLALRLDGRRHTLVLLPDSLGDDDYRRLRVWLGWRAQR